MATIIVCDGGCGAQSPHPKTRLHEANHWLQVRAAPSLRFTRESEHGDKLLCEVCAPRVIEAMKPVTPASTPKDPQP